MSEEETITERRFVYAGRRRTTTNKLVHSWLPEGASVEADDVRLFAKAKGTVIGGIYTIEAGDTTYSPGSVRFTGERADRDTTLAFEALDRVAGTAHSQEALERNAARNSEIKELCAPLRELVRKQVGWQNRAALLAYITSEIGR